MCNSLGQESYTWQLSFMWYVTKPQANFQTSHVQDQFLKNCSHPCFSHFCSPKKCPIQSSFQMANSWLDIVVQGECIVCWSTICDKFGNCRWQHGWCLGSHTGPSKSWLPDDISINHRQKQLFPPFLIWTKSLQHMATGLDNHHPFNNPPVVELILQNAGLMLAPGTPQIGWGHANAVWALMSNFIALDCLSATFGAATAAPGQPVTWRQCEETIAIGTAAEVSLLLPICPIISYINIISSCESSPCLPRYSASSALLGPLVERLRSNLA